MSTRLLSHGFRVKGYDYGNTKDAGGAVPFTVTPKPCSLLCPECGAPKVIRRGTIPRLFRPLPIGDQAVWLSLAVQRVPCLVCGVLRQARIGFADPRRTSPRAFERYALELSKRMPLLDAARHLGGSDVIKDIQTTLAGAAVLPAEVAPSQADRP